MQKTSQIEKLSSTLFSANDLINAVKDKDLATLDFLSKNRPLRLTDQMLENVVFECKDTETLNLVHGYFSLPDKFWIDRLVYSLKRCHGKDHEEIIRYIKENHAHVFSNDHLGRCLTPHLFSVAFNYPERTQILKCHLKDIIPHMSKSSREEFFTGFSLTDHADLCDMIKDVDPENILRILGEISLDTNRGEALSRVQALKAKMSQQHLLDQTSVPERKKASRKI